VVVELGDAEGGSVLGAERCGQGEGQQDEQGRLETLAHGGDFLRYGSESSIEGLTLAENGSA
jgi:hypothetical protein